MKAELTLEQAEEIARIATQKELSHYVAIPDAMDKVALTTLFEGDDRVFVLYIPGKTRDDAMIIASSRVNIKTREISIDIPNLVRKAR